jgi:hypothetical protein
MTDPYSNLSADQPAVYAILVQGGLGKGWEDWFEGMRLVHLVLEEDVVQPGTGEQPPTEATLLTGRVPDQAALLGMLQKLYSFRLSILRVEFVSK